MSDVEEPTMTFSLPTFNDSTLWQQAMTHKSFANEQSAPTEHNERLEFLGDAILTFLSGEYLYTHFPHEPEGELTRKRAMLVDQVQLHHFAQKLHLDKWLRLGKGAKKEGGSQNARLLCSAFEAMIGAYYLDVDQDVQPVRDYVIPMFKRVFESVEIEQALEIGTKDEKTRLQECVQSKMGSIPEYVEISSVGPDHAKEFVVEVQIDGKSYGRGAGASKRKAQKMAAKATLEMLKELGYIC
ncbi:ribonuclease III [cf. Phormidesmis sp. LEGE 11477]|uniref:ribonuclease III n=1 Tax=cf. Phormidesmis sp. LEGE 11477 TaxID=1828680 RepID=UPI0018829BE4|nr:ribonuclease III [cf. Phormidesmis sp. LEGE 11477]MBE9064012.1 ribonuclease III [cf. Phormidesmis sp. LEGE 11477]